MKKTIFTLFAAMMVSLSANAQFYAGGTVGILFDVYGNPSDEHVTSTSTSFNAVIIPEIGYWLNENMAVGAYFTVAPGINGYKNVAHTDHGNMTTTGSSDNFNWSINPYFRYKFAKVGKFKFYADGSVSLGSTTNKISSAIEDQSTTVFNWGIGVAPSIAFSITEKWDAVVNLASIGFYMTGDTSRFGISALNSSSSIGLYYNF